jgi:hypothetical protein
MEATVLSIIWRLVAIGVLLPFAFFPFINIIGIPLMLYLVISLAARIWRRNAAPAPELTRSRPT